ncbi:MAG: DedA family protein [Verrucomicrobiae bacterium]|nr:DedA family protein [Verrucomicrobiae bacterium]
MKEFIDFILHAENHLREFTANYGVWVYALLFLIIFCETGLVITPFLPGDSLLFAIGALAAQQIMDINLLWPLLIVAGILGDSVNYAIGKWIGPKVFHYENNRFFRKDYLMRAHAFYEKYGGRAIVLARFVPIIRTFAPFVAGVGTMTYRKFFFYNVFGAILWVSLFLGAGYFFGNLPFVKSNMKIIILAIIIVSVLPIIWEWWKARKQRPATFTPQ